MTLTEHAEMTLTDLIGEIGQAFQEADPARFHSAWTRAHKIALTLSRLGEQAEAPTTEIPPLLAIQRAGATTREWRIHETPSGYQLVTRTRCPGRMGPWARSGNPIQAADREAAARRFGERIANRPRLLFTSTDDGHHASEGAAAAVSSPLCREG